MAQPRHPHEVDNTKKIASIFRIVITHHHCNLIKQKRSVFYYQLILEIESIMDLVTEFQQPSPTKQMHIIFQIIKQTDTGNKLNSKDTLTRR